MTLTIPDPGSLEIESMSSSESPDGRWHLEITRSETIPLAFETAWFFYVQLQVTSLVDGTTWTPVGEWHAAGLGEEQDPRLVNWSPDGRYLYFTNTFDYHGVECAVYANVGDRLDRLDLGDGTVAAFRSPQLRGLLAVSSDEKWVAYTTYEGEPGLVVRAFADAFETAGGGAPSTQPEPGWRVPLAAAGPDPVSRITWSPDNKQVLVETTKLGDMCKIVSRMTWSFDIETGVFAHIGSVQPADLPALISCLAPSPASPPGRDRYLIFCRVKTTSISFTTTL